MLSAALNSEAKMNPAARIRSQGCVRFAYEVLSGKAQSGGPLLPPARFLPRTLQ